MSLCVILIIAHKELLSDTEKASLKQCYSVLGRHTIRLICPKGLNVNEYLKIAPNAQFEFIDPKWQANYIMFNRLKVVPFLYKKFSNYKFVLFYELDAWVFRDELMYWCDKDYDYIGAPWLDGWNKAKPNAEMIGIGNGGFSLRKIKSHLKALHRFSYIKKPIDLYKEFSSNRSIRSFITLLKNLTFRNNTFILFNDYYLHEDVFWGIIVARNFKWYKLPSTNEALKFSIETAPSRFISEADKLPFGCHAWHKNEPNFWQKYISIT
jgi:hypothetical protein